MPEFRLGLAVRTLLICIVTFCYGAARAEELSVEDAAKRAQQLQAQVAARQAERDAAQQVLDVNRERLQSVQRVLAALPADAAPAATKKALQDEQQTVSAALEDSQKSLDAAQTRLQASQVAAMVASQDHQEALARQTKDSCGETGNHSFCLMAGLFAATGSVAAFQVPTAFRGQTSQQLVSVAIPFVGARWSLGKVVALDLGLLTSVFNKEISLTTGNTTSLACHVQSTTFERHLPCEGDAVIRPYGALFVGPSLGNNDVTWLSFYLVTGWARTAQDPTANYFFGLMFGAAGIHKVISP